MNRFYCFKNVYLTSLFLILCFFYLLILYIYFHNFEMETEADGINHSSAFRFRKHSVEFKSDCDAVVAIILCEMNETKIEGNSPSLANDFMRQINQTIVMLKSIVIMARYSKRTYSCIKIIIISDQREHFEILKHEIFEKQKWDVQFTKYLRFSHVPVIYPDGFYWMKKLFRPCATLRLFLPDLLPNHDSVIYLDTDIIFFRDVRDLWSELNKFSNETLGAMAPCLFHYGSKKNSIPYYGSSGLNAGIMLMNLTRMKNTLWTRKIHMVTAMFLHQIKLADQDILNIYFHYFPEELNLISCDWNFRPFQCRPGSHCEDPSLSAGISAIHGNALSFTSYGPEPIFHSIFQVFEITQLRSNSNFHIQTFIENLNFKLIKVEEQTHSDCTKYGSLTEMIMNRLVQLVR